MHCKRVELSKQTQRVEMGRDARLSRVGWAVVCGDSEGRRGGLCVRIKIYGNPPCLVQMDMGLEQEAEVCAVPLVLHTHVFETLQVSLSL